MAFSSQIHCLFQLQEYSLARSSGSAWAASSPTTDNDTLARRSVDRIPVAPGHILSRAHVPVFLRTTMGQLRHHVVFGMRWDINKQKTMQSSSSDTCLQGKI